MRIVIIVIGLFVALLLMGYSLFMAVLDYKRKRNVLDRIRSRRRNVSVSRDRS